MKNKSRRPHHSSKRIKDEDIIKIKETCDYAKKRKKYITVKNVRKRTKIKNYSDVTMNRYINKSCGKRKNLKHTQPKGGDVSWKSKLKPFQLWQIDIKHLTDIDNLKPYFNKNNDRGLAKYQITARDVATAFPIVAYCSEKSSTYTKMFLEKIFYEFLKQFDGLDLKSITVQTDNGSEFTNKYRKTYGKSPKESNFTLYVYCKFKKHKLNPSDCPTYDSDVETFYWSIERDCLAWDDITDNNSLIKYTTEYITNYINMEIRTRGY